MYELLIIISSFIFILVISLTIIYFMVTSNKKRYEFPPYISKCPDYYEMDKSGECIDSFNYFYTENNKCHKTNFLNEMLNDDEMLCKKKEFAEDCLLNWDGITNNLDICEKMN